MILTSVEMASLSRAMAIIHCKIAMPTRWLARGTHNMAAVGCDWSARSMGKVTDASHDAMAKTEAGPKFFLGGDSANSIFSRTDEDKDGVRQPLQPLVDAMQCCMGEFVVVSMQAGLFHFLKLSTQHATSNCNRGEADGSGGWTIEGPAV